MKKILGLLSLVLVLNGCDDGELEVQTIDFASVTAVKCDLNNLVYKIKGSEALILDLSAANYNEMFINDVTTTVRTLNLDSSNRLIYRSFSSPISTANVCATVIAATPTVTEEWIATSGNMQVTTTAIYNTNTSTGEKQITGYNHNVIFKDITFSKPSGNQVHQTYVFGDYKTSSTLLPFNFNNSQTSKCSSSNVIYSYNGNEAITLEIPSSMYPNTAGVTQTELVSSTNKVTYRLFNSALTPSFFCNATTPTTPVLNQEWIAQNGNLAVDGIIQVVTTSLSALTWSHEIHLKKVTFKKGNSTFTKGDDYILASFTTN